VHSAATTATTEQPAIEIKIQLPDGKEVRGEGGKTTPLEVARRIAKSLAENALVAHVNGEPWDLSRPLPTHNCSLSIYTFDTPEGKKVFWHSAAHLLGLALEAEFGDGAKLANGPPLAGGGFFYDVYLPDGQVITPEHIPRLTNWIEKAIKEKLKFERIQLSKQDAVEMFKDNPYKLAFIEGKATEESSGDESGPTTTPTSSSSSLSAYRCGTLIDLCKGPHVPHAGKFGGFHITKLASSYWQGDATKDSFQRVYGIAFPTKAQLTEWLHQQEEAAKRDHRVVGKRQNLVMFHQHSPGSAFFLPHGTTIYNRLVQFIRSEYRRRGFTEVITPNLYNKDLWVQSGHWDNYKDDMFTLGVDNQQFGLKPMNCPGHCLIYDSRQYSYRELPVRLADFGALHRNEHSGALSGLTRVRRFQQDDAHIFCMPNQIGDEIRGALEFMKHVYGVFGFDSAFQVALSTRPLDKFLGEIETWDRAEEALREQLNASFGQGKWRINEGDGAFYGPKIDIRVTDALGRQHQCATIQLDFQLPIRFNLTYRDQHDQLQRPVMIHRAILGSVERFFAILTEHTGGKWPFWLSPRQAMVVPVSDKCAAYAQQVKDELFQAGFDADVDLTDSTMQKKIREAQLSQYNFILVVGPKEQELGVVNVRTRDNVVQGERSIADLISHFHDLASRYQ
jgi:threonyl-tRNA synthetase